MAQANAVTATTAGVAPGRPVSDVCIGLLLYASTLYFTSNVLLLLPLFMLVLRPQPLQQQASLLLVALFSLVALLNLAFHMQAFEPSRHGSSLAVVLVVMVALLAPAVPPKALKVFVIATCLEVLVGALEYQMGQVALTAGQGELANQELSLDSALLYDLRVFGLSANSSLLAEKIFISLLLTLALPGLFRRRWLPLLLLALGLYLSFNRTAIVCTLIFVLLSLRRRHFSSLRLAVGGAALLAITALLLLNLDDLIVQFTRGSVDELSHSELSRLYFWAKSLELISESPFFGNGSLTFRVEDFVTGLPQHTHNSFLMLAATHGLLPAALLLSYVLINLSRFNWRVVLVMLLFSLTQYFVFWNLSVPDIVLYWFLRQRLGNQPARRHSAQPAPLPAETALNTFNSRAL